MSNEKYKNIFLHISTAKTIHTLKYLRYLTYILWNTIIKDGKSNLYKNDLYVKE